MAKYNNEPEVVASINIVGAGTVITGNVNCNGDIRIDGVLNGNLIAKGKVVIGEPGKIVGEVVCKSADVLGLFDGKLFVSDLLSLKATATVKGEVVTGKLAIEPNCKFTGNCRMDEDALSQAKSRFEKTEEKFEEKIEQLES
jgi:cytoskeletal protein CcmA (bactofilin family)